MKRVLVIGGPGSGKTTFAKQLAKLTKLPLIHLDLYYHDKKHDYYNDKETWRARVLELMKADKWIIDGNYSSSFPERFEQADTIFFLDFPRHKRLYGIYKRRLQFHKKKRDDMPEGWRETVNWEFFRFVWGFEKYRPKIENVLNEKTSKKVIVFTNRTQARTYLENLPL